MKKISPIFIVFILVFCFSCTKTPDSPTGNNKIMIGSTTTDSTSYFQIAVSTQVTDLGRNSIQQHGYCWGTETNPDIRVNHSSLGPLSVQGKFSDQITSLDPATKYYIRPYMTYTYGTIYGQQIAGTTKQVSKPDITTGSISNINYNSACVSVIVNSDGGRTVTKRGVCWNTTGNPTLANCTGSTDNGPGIGSFTSLMTSLSETTLYYVCAYATNTEGTIYGDIRQLTTLQLFLPQVTTSIVTNLTSNSATCGGNVTSDGNGNITVRGVCWNTTGNPNLSNFMGKTQDGSGTGAFTSSITNLNTNVLYYVVAYATNEKGTIYGTEIKQFLACNSMIPYSGKNYNTVMIGSQCWFKQNLNVGNRINGIQNQTNNGIIEKYCYDDNENNCTTYGGLYQWNEMMQYSITEGIRGICPDGWHIPSDGEWMTLVNYLGGGSIAGGKMKSTTGWYNNGNGSNTSGFTAFPGGYRETFGNFTNISGGTVFLSSTAWGSDTVHYAQQIIYSDNEIIRFGTYNSFGNSVRCIHN